MDYVFQLEQMALSLLCVLDLLNLTTAITSWALR